jgi:SAM-dependent methyltransferase
MALHPLATRFASVADTYERGRPDYAPAVVGALAGELGLAPGARVLDLAAGTGKLTRALAAAGLEVIAVEPQAELRAVLADRVPGVEVRDGLAEAIPLEDEAVAAVTVADAFHWFDKPAALAEIGRVLHPGAGLAIVTTVPDWGGASWGHELGQLLTELRPQHPHFDGPPWREAVADARGWEEPYEVQVTIYPRADPERIVDHIASISWVAGMPAQEREATVERVRDLVHSGETPERLALHVVLGLARRSG